MSTIETLIVAQTTRPVDQILTHPALHLAVLRSGDALFAIDEQRLSDLCTAGETLDLADAKVGRALATDIDGGARISGQGNSLIYVRRNSVEQFDLITGTSPRRVPLPGSPGTMVDAALDSGQSCLYATRDDSDADLSRYDLRIANTVLRASAGSPMMSSSIAPQLAWSSAAGEYVAFDPCAEAVWRISPRTRAVKPVDTARLRGRNLVDLIYHPTERRLAIVLTDPRDGSTHLQRAWHADDGVRWESCTRMPDGMIQHLTFLGN